VSPEFAAGPEDAGRRLDHFLQQRLPEYSRSRIQDWIKAGRVRVNGTSEKPSYALRSGDSIHVSPGQLPSLKAFAEDIPIQILYADSDVLALNKPAGMVVHAGAGRHSGTLVNALLHHFGKLSSAGGEERPGIVHRLDRDTSGVLIAARTDRAHRLLADQFASREVEKAYLALVEGQIRQDEGRIESRIERDPVRRTRMTARTGRGRSALTYYKVLQRLPRHTFVELWIGTGRTHQIRVHMASLRHPVAGDTLYGAAAAEYGRFFLHAHRIRFRSPSSGELISVEAPLPEELERWLQAARGS
jgi:23S rRNA pseudouridine1911/1915/1917 synthase